MRLIPLLLLLGTAAASAQPPAVVGSRVVGEARSTVTATVETVDRGARTVLVRREDGSLIAFRAGPEIRNLDRIRPGDQVVAEVRETIRLSVVRGAAPPPGYTAGVARAPEGAAPGMVAVDSAQTTAKIERIDPATRTVALRSLDDRVREVRLASDIDIGRLAVGDTVVATLTRSAAVAVRPAAGR